MSENTDTLKGGYDAFNSGDTEALAGVFHDDVRWEGSNNEKVPGGGTHDGRDAALAALGQAVDAFESISTQPDEWIEDGDTVVVLGHNEAKAKSTGKSVKVPFVHVWRFEGGKVKRAQLLTDTAVVAEALEG